MAFMTMFLLVAIFALLLTLKSSLNNKIQQLENEVRNLSSTISKLTSNPKQADLNVIQEEKIEEPEPIVTEDPYWTTGFQVIDTEENKLQEEDKIKQWLQEDELLTHVTTEHQIEPSFSTDAAPTSTYKAPKPSFFERNPDLEKFIGENLISKIGIGILVLAIGYFVKFAIDNDWINETGRVAIGLACGGILVGLAHKLRKNYKAFSSVLVGGGIAVFYFTIALAYHQFHLFGQTSAFVIMLLITGLAVALSLWYNREEVAIIALVGGFASPFMVSNGSGNYKTLFIYLILLNTGLLIIAYNKAWRLLNLLAFVFTITSCRRLVVFITGN